MRSTGRCFAVIGAIALVWPLTARAQQDQPIESVVQSNKQYVGVVLARSSDGSVNQGTVFLTYRRGFAITAAHVVADRVGWLTVQFPECFPLPASRSYENKDTDVAVLSLYTPEGRSRAGPFDKCPQLSPSTPSATAAKGLAFASPASIHEGQQIVVIGFPRPDVLGSDTATITTGVVSAIRGGALQIQAPVSPGSSGSPVLNMRGQVIGMVRGTLAGEQQGLNFATSVSDLHKALCWGLAIEGVITVDEFVTCH